VFDRIRRWISGETVEVRKRTITFGHLKVSKELKAHSVDPVLVSAQVHTEKGDRLSHLLLEIYDLKALAVFKRNSANSLSSEGDIAKFQAVEKEYADINFLLRENFGNRLNVYLVSNDSDKRDLSWSLDYSCTISVNEVMNRILARIAQIDTVPVSYRSTDWYAWVLRQYWKLLFVEAIEQVSIPNEQGNLQTVVNRYIRTSTDIQQLRINEAARTTQQEINQAVNLYWRSHDLTRSESPHLTHGASSVGHLNYGAIAQIALSVFRNSR